MFNIQNINTAFLRIFNKVKNFLLKPKSREFFVFLFFFAIASGFWLLQTLNEEYDRDFRIPVKLIHVPDNVVLTNDKVECLDVKVRDKGTVLLNYIVGRNFSPVEIDFTALSKRNKNEVRLSTAILEKQIVSKFSVSTKLLAIEPDSLEFIFAKGVAKRVPVALKGKIEANSQYVITDTIISPDSVSIYAPAELLSQIDVAYSVELDLLDLSDSTSIKVPLQYIKGVKYLPEEIQVELPVDILTEKTVRVPLHGVNFPSDKILRTFPSSVDITFQIGTRQFNRYSAADFMVDIDYQNLLDLSTDTYPIRITKFPADVQRLRVSPRKVDFLIEQKASNLND